MWIVTCAMTGMNWLYNTEEEAWAKFWYRAQMKVSDIKLEHTETGHTRRIVAQFLKG